MQTELLCRFAADALLSMEPLSAGRPSLSQPWADGQSASPHDCDLLARRSRDHRRVGIARPRLHANHTVEHSVDVLVLVAVVQSHEMTLLRSVTLAVKHTPARGQPISSLPRE
jgi:hypothetical protein